MRRYSYSKLQELVPDPAVASGQFGDDDITPVIRFAASHKRNLAAGVQHADLVPVAARDIVNVHIAGHCCDRHRGSGRSGGGNHASIGDLCRRL